MAYSKVAVLPTPSQPESTTGVFGLTVAGSESVSSLPAGFHFADELAFGLGDTPKFVRNRLANFDPGNESIFRATYVFLVFFR